MLPFRKSYEVVGYQQSGTRYCIACTPQRWLQAIIRNEQAEGIIDDPILPVMLEDCNADTICDRCHGRLDGDEELEVVVTYGNTRRLESYSNVALIYSDGRLIASTEGSFVEQMHHICPDIAATPSRLGCKVFWRFAYTHDNGLRQLMDDADHWKRSNDDRCIIWEYVLMRPFPGASSNEHHINLGMRCKVEVHIFYDLNPPTAPYQIERNHQELTINERTYKRP